MRGEISIGTRDYCVPEKAYELLKKASGQDFGWDCDRWEKWIDDNAMEKARAAGADVSTRILETDDISKAATRARWKYGSRFLEKMGLTLSDLSGMKVEEFKGRLKEVFGYDES